MMAWKKGLLNLSGGLYLMMFDAESVLFLTKYIPL